MISQDTTAHRRYSILIVSSEFAPLAATGGLGDMVAALAASLKRRGHDVRVALPLYSRVRREGFNPDTALPAMRVAMGGGELWCAIRRSETEEGIPLYFIERDDYFDRPGLYYDEQYKSYPDNPARFGFLCRAALQLAADLPFIPDIIQVHDWPTALVPAYLKTGFAKHPFLGKCPSLLTIHNEAHQGIFSADHYRWLGLPAGAFTSDIFEDRGLINFLKGGIHFAEAVNTVSPTHAEEMKAPFGAFGLAPHIARKGASFRGILNGADYDIWSPEKDRFIAARYFLKDMSGKTVCKQALQRQFYLEERPDLALIGFIGRLTLQKGVHLLQDFMEHHFAAQAVQFVVLGSGEPQVERFFSGLPTRFPGRIGAYIGFNNELAHRIEAGADFFVMPSLYEPCGLNQIYSLKYGTLPIVHATGGLEDTVEDYDERTGNGTGFKFREPSAEALHKAIARALAVYDNRPDHILLMMRKAMQQDFSWDRSVHAYEGLFAEALSTSRTAEKGG
jgi:starch synthase